MEKKCHISESFSSKNTFDIAARLEKEEYWT